MNRYMSMYKNEGPIQCTNNTYRSYLNIVLANIISFDRIIEAVN